MKSSTTIGLGQKPLTLDDISAAIDKISAIPKEAKKWFVISPDGLMYYGDPQDVIRPLLAAHPLMKANQLMLDDKLSFNSEGNRHERFTEKERCQNLK